MAEIANTCTIEPVGYTRREFQARWKISESTFFRWVRSGKLHVIRVGDRVVRVPFEEDERLRREGG